MSIRFRDWVIGEQEKRGLTIQTEQHYADQWTAIDAATYDGAEDAGRARVMGFGRTEAEAVADLIEQMEDK